MAGASVFVALSMWGKWGGVEINLSYLFSHVEWFLLILIWFLLAAACGVYELQVASNLGASLRALLLASCIALLIYLVVYFFSPPGSLPRVMALGQVFSLTMLVGFWRCLYLLLMRAPEFSLKVLVIGAGLSGQRITQVAKGCASLPYSLVGFIDDDPSKRAPSILDLTVLGTSEELVQLCRSYGISELIFAISGSIRPELFRALLVCQEQGIRITPMSVVYEELTGRVPLGDVSGGNWHVVLPTHHPQTRTLYAFLKRGIDIAVAIVGLTLFVPLLPVLAIAIRLDSQGPIFYRQARVGRGGRIFRLIKLRTMISGAESGSMRTAADDPRITRVGKLLRTTMLDEAPQFWNVLKGEISFVGPRPEQPELVSALEEEIPFYRLRHAVKPGMAGWALIHQGQIRSFGEALARLEYDLYYIKHQSLWLDILIILRTIWRAMTFRWGERVAEDHV